MGSLPLMRRLWFTFGFFAAMTVSTSPLVPVWAEVRNPKGVAVIIGNGDYEHRDVPDVKYAHRDAEAFKRYVLEVLGFDPNNVIDVRDATRRRLFDVLGTRSDPRSDLWSYLNPKGGSDVVVFYSGHGVPGQKDGRGYLLPVDADPKAAEEDGYPIDLLYRNLGELKEARGVQVFLEACFSGGSHGGGLVGSASPVFVKASLPQSSGNKVTSLTAASGEQIASWDEEAKHGLFTRHLLDALYGKADADRDGKVTAVEAKEYLDQHMTRSARRMHRRVQEANLMGSAEVVLVSVEKNGKDAPTRRPDPGPPQREGDGTEQAVAPSPPAGHEAAEGPLGLDRSERRRIQKALASLGFDPGKADGLFGRKTRGAIKRWQTSRDREATGHLDAESAKALLAVVEEVSTPTRDASSPKDAVDTLAPAIAVAERIKEADDRSRIYSWIAEVLVKAGKLREAEQSLVKALEAAEASKDYGRSWAFSELAEAWAEAARPGLALQISERIDDEETQQWTLRDIAKAQAGAGKARDAEKTLHRALKAAEALENRLYRGRAFYGLAEIQAEFGKRRDAERMLSKALAAAEDIPEALYRSALFRETAAVQVKFGNLRDAAKSLSKAVIAAERIEDTCNFGATEFARIAVVQSKAGNARNAAKSFAEARARANKCQTDGKGSSALRELIEEQAKSGGFRQALATTEKIEDAYSRSLALAEVAAAQAKAEKGQAAAKSFAKALAAAGNIQDERSRESAFSDIAWRQAEAGNIEDAVSIAQRLVDDWYRARALNSIATAQAKARKFRDAVATAEGILDDKLYAEALIAVAREQVKPVGDAAENDRP